MSDTFVSANKAYLVSGTLGLLTPLLLGLMPECYAYFFFCFYPSDLA
jgi:hypothetical protein